MIALAHEQIKFSGHAKPKRPSLVETITNLETFFHICDRPDSERYPMFQTLNQRIAQLADFRSPIVVHLRPLTGAYLK